MLSRFERTISEDSDTTAMPSTNEARRVLICTTPRTAGHMLCDMMGQAGWGNPTEYFHPDFATRLYERWSGQKCSSVHLVRRNAKAYGEALLKHRSFDSIFSAKIFFGDLAFAREAIGDEDKTCCIYLTRRDKIEQTISLAATLITKRPFDDETILENMPTLGETNTSTISYLFSWLC